MRYFKIFIIGFLPILIIQFGILVFLETVYFADNSSYSSKKVENDSTKDVSKPKLVLEEGSINTSASYDGKYLAYLKNNDLLVLNLDNASKTKVSADVGMEIVYYKWIYDRNRLILAERSTDTKNDMFFKLYYYDVDSNNKVEIFNEVNNRSIKIPIYSGNERIDAIDMSTLTNAIYVKLSSSNDYSRIYRINIMAQEKSINTVTHDIGKIISTKRDDVLLYENSKDRKVFEYGNSSPLEVDGNSNLCLLGIDNKDNIYLAPINNDKTQTIYYGSITNKDWKKINIKTLIDINDIYINIKGQIFIKDTSKSIIKELSIGKETYYNGKIIGIYNNGIISEKNNEITKSIFQ
ncbi:hypothetical protein JMF89_03905 [Clostridiaceae bacterium UIB06]|uniref:Dipeptidylpeptidase IV N-terminal domain-containing protein n=1 Tax=Clostridium thailandense TaxID=2794346 RepID=A0A949WPQ7_9CLOT|nr:hypothetical protein [Clostridium thailandense]MBV7271671.1 hypothetical protein [Clostridium thailandense]MCH5136358.1 hypothetical protein [Clostridiaceae bacterium UIB06]